MCRLTGFTDMRPFQKYDKRATLEAMRDSMRRGGPNGRGTWMGGSAAIGHVRLSILDLSEDGSQPMTRGPQVLAWNGELYNFRELRSVLMGMGYRFTSQSDTEVVIQAFRAWGPEAVDRFQGMFAFALWNTDRQELLLGRDPLGIKPLYWYLKDGLFMFASELKAFHEHPHFDRSISPEAVALFLQQGYIHAPLTIFHHAKKMEPGTLLFWRPETGALTTKRYFSASDALYQRPLFQGDEQEALEELERLVKESLRFRLVSDVPLGAFLSGGIDSSTLTALLQQVTGSPISTYTIGFEQADLNEAPLARAVAQHLGSDHHEAICTEQDFASILPVYPEVYDEPFGDSSGIPSLVLSQMAGNEAGVALAADGADELFGGYVKYSAVLRVYPWFTKTGWAGKVALKVASLMQPEAIERLAGFIPRMYRPTNLAARIEKGKAALRAENWQESFHLASSSADPHIVKRLSGALPPRYPHLPDPPHQRRLAAMALIDLPTYLEGDILAKMDRASMYHALEVREPFLDTSLVTFAMTLPDHFKIRGRTSKYLLRQLLYKYVPRALVDRPKQGFGVPLEKWLRSTLKEDLLQISHQHAVHQSLFLDSAATRMVIDAFIKKKSSPHTALIWYIYVLHKWHERWMG